MLHDLKYDKIKSLSIFCKGERLPLLLFTTSGVRRPPLSFLAYVFRRILKICNRILISSPYSRSGNCRCTWLASVLLTDKKWGLQELGPADSTTTIPPSHLVFTLRNGKKPCGERGGAVLKKEKAVLSHFTRPPLLRPRFPPGGDRAGRADWTRDVLTSGAGGSGKSAGPKAGTGTQKVTAGRARLAAPTASGTLGGTPPPWTQRALSSLTWSRVTRRL